MGDRTRLIVISNLHNPSGALVEENVLRELGALAAERNAHILIDEVYIDSAVPPRRSAAHLGPEFVCTNSLTKVYGLSGLRCGWILAEPELAERMWRLNDLFGVNQAHQAERLACIAFEHLDAINAGNADMLASNRARWNIFVEGRDDLTCAQAEHGITAFPRWAGGDTEHLAAHLRGRYDTAIVPGRWFEMPEHFRVGFGLSQRRFRRGPGPAQGRAGRPSMNREAGLRILPPAGRGEPLPDHRARIPEPLHLARRRRPVRPGDRRGRQHRDAAPVRAGSDARADGRARRGGGARRDQDDRPVQHQGEERHRLVARR